MRITSTRAVVFRGRKEAPVGSDQQRDEHPHRPAGRPEPIGDDPAALADLVGQVTRSLRRRWADGIGSLDLSPHQARALRVIANGGAQRLSAVAQALRIAPRSATEVVDALEEQGLVERAADPDDRRAVLVRQTAEGERVRAAVEAARAADADDFFGRLDDADRREWGRLLRPLLADR